ncbi:Oxysterol binding protein, partial [Linnemannia elongata]
MSKDTINDTETAPAVPEGQKDSLSSFVATLASFSGDLSSLTCPSFLLSSVSLLEYSQYWGDHPKLFASISKGETPEERLLNATRWFISTLYGSYSSRSTTAGMEKKPYNPVLGEQYFAKWTGDEETGDTILKAEQVSHHPPTGHAILTLPQFKEHYLITLPNLNIRGMVTGRPSVELSGTTYIVSSAGHMTTIEYSTKGYFSGERHSFKATLKPIEGGS